MTAVKIAGDPCADAQRHKSGKEGARNERGDPVHRALRSAGSAVMVRMQLRNRTHRLVDVFWNVWSEGTVRHRALATEDRGLARPRRGLAS